MSSACRLCSRSAACIASNRRIVPSLFVMSTASARLIASKAANRRSSTSFAAFTRPSKSRCCCCQLSDLLIANRFAKTRNLRKAAILDAAAMGIFAIGRCGKIALADVIGRSRTDDASQPHIEKRSRIRVFGDHCLSQRAGPDGLVLGQHVLRLNQLGPGCLIVAVKMRVGLIHESPARR